MQKARKRAAAAQTFKVQGRDLLARVQIKRCSEILTVALEADPNSISARFMLVACLLQLGDFAAAREQASSTITDLCEEKGGALQEPALHFAAAYACLGSGNTEEAITFLEDAVKSFPSEPQPCAALSTVFEREGRWPEARAAAVLALEREAGTASGKQLLPSQRRRSERLLQLDAAAGSAEAVVDAVASTAAADDDLQPTAAGDQLGKKEGCGSPKICASSNVLAMRANSREVAAPSPPSTRVRWRTFGPPCQEEATPGNEAAVREAAFKDLETLFSNLMPAAVSGAHNREQVGDSESAAIGSEACCSCSCRKC